MSSADFTAVPVRPCIKCGTLEKTKHGRCKACEKIRIKAWQVANKDRVKANVAAWGAANPESGKERQKAYRIRHADEIKKRRRASDLANKEHKRQLGVAWRKANRESIVDCENIRRGKIKDGGGRLSKGLAQKLFALQKGKCPCCGVSLSDGYHMDHIIPLFLGGPNEDSNMQLLSPLCNMSKNKTHPVDFMQSRGFLL